jgi:queuosine precursor transporter
MNELLLGVQAAVCTLFVILTWRFARERLYGVITLFLILIGTVGGKIVYFFGHATNTGNIFYASIFLATYFLIERMGRRQGIYAIWMSVIAVAFFFVLVQIAIAFVGSPATAHFNAAIEAAFSPFSRVTVASLIAYILSQNLNVYVYCYLKERWSNSHIWLRANISNILAQILDSVVFFTIAFWGIVAPGNIVDIILTGFAIKAAFIAVTTPLLYLNRVELDDGKDYSQISMR